MKIAFDENVPIALVRVFRVFAEERQLRRRTGDFQIESAVDYTPKPGDPDYQKKNDAPWIKRFADAGGRVIISGNTEMRYVPHERLALVQAQMIVFFFSGKWNQLDFFRKCSLLMHRWPEIAQKAKRGKRGCFWHVPLSWSDSSKLQRLTTDDPRKLRIERQKSAESKVKRRRAIKDKSKQRQPHPLGSMQGSLFDLLESAVQAAGSKVSSSRSSDEGAR